MLYNMGSLNINLTLKVTGGMNLPLVNAHFFKIVTCNDEKQFNGPLKFTPYNSKL